MAEQKEKEKGQASSAKRGFSWVTIVVRSIIVVLAVCRLLPYETYLCVALFSLYVFLMSRYAFPKSPSQPDNLPSFVQGSLNRNVFVKYIRAAAYIGLYFPFLYIVAGTWLGQKGLVHTAAPHTFLLACQVLSERLSASLSPPCLALVPIIYNSGRIVSIWAWLQSDFLASSASNWILIGRVLAVANLLFWSYNLFGFLLPHYLPFCFKRYFEYEEAKQNPSPKIS